jgi:hypothetical protein
MPFLIHPTYFPTISVFSLLAQKECIWEVQDNYQKQTYRNRCYICTDQGKHMLNIPIQHVGGNQGRQLYKEVRVDNEYKWQRQHWRTLQTAYRTSPFFEYYEDDLAPLFHTNYKFLLDFNFEAIEIIGDCLQVAIPVKKTKEYYVQPTDMKDVRFLVSAKKSVGVNFPLYTQVFGQRHGFLDNLSILDLLFNEGTSAPAYLENLSLKTLDE